MTPRRRTPARTDWPEGLHRNGRGYYYFRMPKRFKDKGKYYSDTGLGRDYIIASKHAITALAKLTLRYSGNLPDRLTSPVLKKTKTTTPFKPWVYNIYVEKIIPKKTVKRQGEWVPISKPTIKEYIRIAKKLADSFDVNFEQIDLDLVGDHLVDIPAHTHKKTRWIFCDIFKYAISLGVKVDNVPLMTLPERPVVVTKRMTIKGYKSIYAKACPWLQIAMDLGLQTLQRLKDISNMQHNQIEEDFIGVIQSKTGATVAIQLSEPLTEILQRSRDLQYKGTALASPYIVHKPHKHNKGREQWAEDRKHPTQVIPEKITREFKIARDGIPGNDKKPGCGFYKLWPIEERPTFREIRPLGADLYRLAGMPEHEIQKLLGHRSAKTTQVYLARHGIRWTKAKSGLDI